MKNILLVFLCTVMLVFGMVGVAGAMTFTNIYATEIYLCLITLFVSIA